MYLLGKTAILPWNEKNIETIPDVAGVYLFRNTTRQVIYIGTAGAGRLYEIA